MPELLIYHYWRRQADQKQVLSHRLASRFFGQQLSRGAIASLTAPVNPPLGLVLSPVESGFVYTQHHNVKSV